MKLPSWVIGEFLGTFLLVFIGCGSVCVSVVTEVELSLVQVATIWGLGIALAINVSANRSGAHLNPAVTLALLCFRDFEKEKVLGYWLSQVMGAFCAAALLHAVFAGAIREFEQEKGLLRGEAGSEASAMIYGEYFPNPGGEPLDEAARESLTVEQAFLVEAGGTAFLVFMIFTLTQRRRPKLECLFPFLIGGTVALLIVMLAPLTQGGFNPARDFGPRVFSALAGWGELAFTTNGPGWYLVYLIGPCVGGLAGAGCFEALRRASKGR